MSSLPRSHTTLLGRRPFVAPLLVLALLALPGAAHAQSSPRTDQKPKPKSTRQQLTELTQQVEDQRRLVERQQQLIEAQAASLAAQEKRLAELEQRLAATSEAAATTQAELREVRQLTTDEAVAKVVESRLGELEQTVQKVPEMALREIQGEFPGSFRIPGTDAALRIGGRVRMTYINSFDAIGTDDRFITSSIPREGSEEAGKTSRVEFSVIPSRFNFDLRTATGVGYMRAFLEADFAGGNDHLRLRHAFGQWRRWLVGQTWSTFSDPEAEPDGLDFEGLNAISMFRQPQIRWTRPLNEQLSLAVAIEEARPDLSGITGVNQVPDAVLRLRFDPERALLPGGLLGQEGSHVQAAVVLRQLRGEIERIDGSPVETLSTTGYGINLSGVVPAPWAKELDRFRFAWNAGRGIGRYITDLDSLGGQDAVYDAASDRLEAIPVASAYLGYEHGWRPTVRSTVTAGYVWVDNLESQGPDALHRTERFTLNLAWSPIPRLDLVFEYLWGRRIDADDRSGEAGQIQMGGTFRF